MATRRQLKCTKCGASVEVQPGEDMAFCEYCGAYSNPDGTVYFPNPDKRSRELKRKMGEALADDNMDLWRAYMYESCQLSMKKQPDLYKNAPTDKHELREYIHKQVKQYELLNFNKDVKKAFENCQGIINKLMKVKKNHSQACKELLKGYREYFNSFLYHPEYPYDTNPGDAEQQAIDTTRSAINQYAPLWGEDIISQIMIDVFSDIQTTGDQVSCDSCGVVLDIGESSSVKCPSCGTIMYINK